MLTSLELSKKLKENGCNFPTYNEEGAPCNRTYLVIKEDKKEIDYIKKYDILYDICVKYKGKFFGGFYKKLDGKLIDFYKPVTKRILEMMQEDYSQKEIEEFIWDNCLFNKKNVGKK